MAEATSEAHAAPSWMYVNEMRVIGFVMAAAMLVLGIGLLIYIVDGAEQMDTVDVFLGTGVFFILFAVLLFVPRLRSRGAMSFSLLVEDDLDDVERAVASAVEESGRKPSVTAGQARFRRPPREIAVEGVSWKFTLQAAPYRERKEDGTQWTEIIQVGLENEKDEVARELRERVLTRLATSGV
ncbi:MAG TPA: hypothetical protein VEY12_07000 [Thermoplasmata archaeon]|nr:hypothetical protein [Thermoplasmata archaeon]